MYVLDGRNVRFGRSKNKTDGSFILLNIDFKK
jgi:hypothetical protein